MSEQEKKYRSLFDRFAELQETFEDAKKKNSEESSKRANYFRMQKDGTYVVRILPLAPVVNADGDFLPLERKGYEYPLRSLMLKIEDTVKNSTGKAKVSYVSVCNAKHKFEGLESDLIDMFVKVASEKYADDEKLVKKLREGSFSGGLKWDSKRCLYIIDVDNPGDGIQILQLSYKQYKDLEERKLLLWSKLNKNGKRVGCPISSINDAYPVEIIRKTENGKASYSFNIDTVADKEVLDEDTLQALIELPRLPEVIYRYTRYHLEATIVFLQQLEAKFDIQVMNEEPILDCIEQIKMLLPADDNSHFTIGDHADNKEAAPAITIDSLWDRLDNLEDAGLDDRSVDGQELRQDIRDFIESNNLDIKLSHKKTNNDLLEEIENAMHGADEEPEEKPAPRQSTVEPEPQDDDEDAEPAEPQDDEEEEPAPRLRSRNDDTNEPAARTRRAGRPARRR